MNMDRNVPWAQISVEGLAIVTSILLAFSIDAWWDERQRHETEQAVLQTLLDDLRVKQVLLSDMNLFNKAIVESAETLLRVAAGAEQEPNEDRIDRLIADIWWVSNEALWDSAPLNLVASSGGLSLVSNSRLVQELAALQVAIGRVRYHYRNDGEFHNNVVTPFMIANANMAQISASMLHRPGQPQVKSEFPDLGFANNYRHSELLANVAFQNLLVAKIERCTDILDIGHPGVEKHLNVVISMLQHELDK